MNKFSSSKFISTIKMSLRLFASSESSPRKKSTEGLSNQNFVTDLVPKQSEDNCHST